MEAVTLIRKEMPKNLPLIGFSGSPWTLACYMIEGEGNSHFKKALTMMYEYPQSMHILLQKLSELIQAYLKGQIDSGVNVCMLFDTWGGLLPNHYFHRFSLAYMKKIVQFIKQEYPHIPIILFTKGGGQWLESLAQTGCDALSLDWTVSLKEAKAKVGQYTALQGNLDPTVLLTSPACIEKEVQRVLEEYGNGLGHVFNLGHGITPDIPPENVTALIEAVHKWSPAYHG